MGRGCCAPGLSLVAPWGAHGRRARGWLAGSEAPHLAAAQQAATPTHSHSLLTTHPPTRPPLQYKPHNQTQHSDKGHKSAHHGHAHPHGHKGGKPHHGGKAANGGVAHKGGKPPAAAHVHVQTDAPGAAATNGESAAAASS